MSTPNPQAASPSPWARPPFSAVAAVYDHLMRDVFTHRQTRILSDAQEYLGLAPPGRWTDVACGTGEIAAWLAGQGWDVHASDLSPEMLEVAREKARLRGLDVAFACQDMRGWNTPGAPFDVVTCCFDSLNNLTRRQDLVRAFRSVRRALRPGGFYLFDVVTPHQVRHMWDYCDRVHEGDGYFGAWESKALPQPDMVQVLMRWFIREPETGLFFRADETHRIRGYGFEQVAMALNEAGLAVVAAYDGDDDFLAPLQDNTMRMDFIARKPE